jgi:hypothetical protein
MPSSGKAFGFAGESTGVPRRRLSSTANMPPSNGTGTIGDSTVLESIGCTSTLDLQMGVAVDEALVPHGDALLTALANEVADFRQLW